MTALHDVFSESQRQHMESWPSSVIRVLWPLQNAAGITVASMDNAGKPVVEQIRAMQAVRQWLTLASWLTARLVVWNCRHGREGAVGPLINHQGA